MWPQPRTLGVGEAGWTLLGCLPSTAVGASICSLSCPLVILVATQEKTRLGLVEMGACGLPAPRGPAEEIWAPKYPRIKTVMIEMRGPMDMARHSFQVGSKFLPSALEHEDTLGLWFSRCHCTTLGGAMVRRGRSSGGQPLRVLWLSA